MQDFSSSIDNIGVARGCMCTPSWHAPAANVQVSNENCSSLTDKTFNTRSHHIAGFGSGKTARAPTLSPFHNYNSSSERSEQAKIKFAVGAPP
jgi:hypothetical protein